MQNCRLTYHGILCIWYRGIIGTVACWIHVLRGGGAVVVTEVSIVCCAVVRARARNRCEGCKSLTDACPHLHTHTHTKLCAQITRFVPRGHASSQPFDICCSGRASSATINKTQMWINGCADLRLDTVNSFPCNVSCVRSIRSSRVFLFRKFKLVLEQRRFGL
jgi:hypothetical protein